MELSQVVKDFILDKQGLIVGSLVTAAIEDVLTNGKNANPASIYHAGKSIGLLQQVATMAENPDEPNPVRLGLGVINVEIMKLLSQK